MNSKNKHFHKIWKTLTLHPQESLLSWWLHQSSASKWTYQKAVPSKWSLNLTTRSWENDASYLVPHASQTQNTACTILKKFCHILPIIIVIVSTKRLLEKFIILSSCQWLQSVTVVKILEPQKIQAFTIKDKIFVKCEFWNCCALAMINILVSRENIIFKVWHFSYSTHDAPLLKSETMKQGK